MDGVDLNSNGLDYCVRKNEGKILVVAVVVQFIDITVKYITRTITKITIPHQKLLQSDWSFTHQHFRCLGLSPFDSFHMTDNMHLRKPNICHVKDTMATWGKVTFPCGTLLEKVRHYLLRREDAVILARVHTLSINVSKPIERAIKIK